MYNHDMAKYAPETLKEICSYLEEGMTQKDASVLAGICEDTFYEWKHKYPEFSESIMRSQATYRHNLVKVANKKALSDPETALEVLSRRWPKMYGSKQHEGTSNEDVSFEEREAQQRRAQLSYQLS